MTQKELTRGPFLASLQDPLAILPASAAPSTGTVEAAARLGPGEPGASAPMDASDRLWAALGSVPGSTLKRFMEAARVELQVNPWDIPQATPQHGVGGQGPQALAASAPHLQA